MRAMKKVLDAVKWFFLDGRCLFWLGMTITLLATTIEVVRGRNTNYFDYQDSTRMFWEGLTPYTLEFAQAHSLYFLYLPVFCVLFAPIFLLPWWLGPYIWNIGNFVLFSLAIWMLPKPLAPHRTKIYLFLLSVLMQSIFCYRLLHLYLRVHPIGKEQAILGRSAYHDFGYHQGLWFGRIGHSVLLP